MDNDAKAGAMAAAEAAEASAAAASDFAAQAQAASTSSGGGSSEYEAELAAAANDDYDDLDRLKFLQLAGRDLAGRPLVLIVGRHVPMQALDGDRLRRYIIKTMGGVASAGDYSILYVHTDVQVQENSPGLVWLIRTYRWLPSWYKQHLKSLYVLHPGIGLRASLLALSPFFSELWSKMVYISRTEFLLEYIANGQVGLPTFVHEHDTLLEHAPLYDYGFAPDPVSPTPVP